MKFCAKCGKEILDEAVICPGCGCAVAMQASAPKVSYEQAISNSGVMVAVGSILLALGVFVALFVNVFLGAVLCLAAEIVFVIPNTKIQKLFKQNNYGISDKAKLKAEEKALRKELKKSNKAYAAASVLSIIALVCVIAFALMI